MIKGSMITATRSHHKITRNSSYFKKVDNGVEPTLPTTTSPVSEKMEEEDHHESDIPTAPQQLPLVKSGLWVL